MKQIALIFLTLLCAHFLSAQESVNQKDAEGKKQGKWIYYGKDRPESGIPKDSIYEFGNYVDDRKDGTWTRRRPDGTWIKGEYENNRPSTNCMFGSNRSTYPEKGTMVKNQYRDSLTRYYSDGTKEYEAWYDETGKEHGTVNYYFNNGQLEFTYKANRGTPIDTAYRYYENGDLKEMIVYGNGGQVTESQKFEAKNPIPQKPRPENAPEIPGKLPKSPNTLDKEWKPNGYNKVFNSDDEIWQDGLFKDGILQNGKEYIYDEDGILLKVYIFKDGLFYSEGQL